MVRLKKNNNIQKVKEELKEKDLHEIEKDNSEEEVLKNIDTITDKEVLKDVVPFDFEEKSKKTKKTICRVIVATPSYFVIDKEGEKITINKKNNHYRNEEIYF